MTLIIVDKLSDISSSLRDEEALDFITTNAFLESEISDLKTHKKVINLCGHYRYLSTGYYCSLLGESKGLDIIPSVRVVLDGQQPEQIKNNLQDLVVSLHRGLKRFNELPGTRFSILICFGYSKNNFFKEFSKAIFVRFRAPIIRVDIQEDKTYKIKRIAILGMNTLTASEKDFLEESLLKFLKTRQKTKTTTLVPRWSLAILVNPEEKLPPSNPRAISKFQKIGSQMGIEVQLIHKKDYHRVSEFDALFIRETTMLTDHTYSFSLKAESEGIPVIDSPTCIMRSTNKIFMHNLFVSKGIPIPQAVIFSKSTMSSVGEKLGYPMVIKIPDGNFSKGIHKVSTEAEFKAVCATLFVKTELLLAQAFVPTDYDWRIGVLSGVPLFACKYWMAPNHWQIYKQLGNGRVSAGNSEGVPIEKVDPELLKLAVTCSDLVGKGLYGVDIKQTPTGYVVMEVNDNPNVDAGVEDIILKDELYRRILVDIQNRVIESWTI